MKYTKASQAERHYQTLYAPSLRVATDHHFEPIAKNFDSVIPAKAGTQADSLELRVKPESPNSRFRGNDGAISITSRDKKRKMRAPRRQDLDYEPLAALGAMAVLAALVIVLFFAGR